MRKPRAIESPDQRYERFKENLRRFQADVTAADDEADERVRRSIAEHGA